MRVALVNSHGDDLAVGGAERYIADLVAGLARRGHEPVVIRAFPTASERDGALTVHRTDWRTHGTRRLRNRAGDLVSSPTTRLREIVERVDPDIVHTNNLPGITTAAWEIGRRLQKPVVHTLHDYYLLCPRATLERRDGTPCAPHPLLCGLRTRRLKRWSPAVDHVIAGSRHLFGVHEGFFPDADTTLIRLPLAPVADRALRAPFWPPRTVGYLGALHPGKGILPLLDAAAGLAELGVRLRIAGDGQLRAAVSEASDGALDYVGHVTGAAKVEFMESVDVALVPSRWEEPSGPPYTVLEWLAAGRPVLVSRRGGLEEAADMDGVLVIEPSGSGIVDGVRRLLDETTWHAVAGKVRQLDDDQDVQRWLGEHEAVYEKALR